MRVAIGGQIASPGARDTKQSRRGSGDEQRTSRWPSPRRQDPKPLTSADAIGFEVVVINCEDGRERLPLRQVHELDVLQVAAGRACAPARFAAIGNRRCVRRKLPPGREDGAGVRLLHRCRGRGPRGFRSQSHPGVGRPFAAGCVPRPRDGLLLPLKPANCRPRFFVPCTTVSCMNLARSDRHSEFSVFQEVALLDVTGRARGVSAPRSSSGPPRCRL